MVVVGVAYMGFGSLGYVCYGDSIDSVITQNLPVAVSYLFYFILDFLFYFDLVDNHYNCSSFTYL